MNGTARLVLAACCLAVVSCSGGGARGPRSPTAIAAAPPAVPTLTSHERWPFGPEPTSEVRGAQVERLRKDPGPLKTNWVPPGRAERYGHAEGLIAAPFEAVRERLLDFPRYRELAGPKFSSVYVVNKQGADTDVYFKLPVMKGIFSIWYVTRFAPPRAMGSGEVIEGTFVRGNIRGMHLAFTIRPAADEQATVLVCDLSLRPKLPAPQSALDEELRDACGDAIRSVRRLVARP